MADNSQVRAARPTAANRSASISLQNRQGNQRQLAAGHGQPHHLRRLHQQQRRLRHQQQFVVQPDERVRQQVHGQRERGSAPELPPAGTAPQKPADRRITMVTQTKQPLTSPTLQVRRHKSLQTEGSPWLHKQTTPHQSHLRVRRHESLQTEG
ncbi:uncharacterized protein LOC144875280 isoform X2 [Branchiostoma floridae x Branchiostoma japonicum]